MPIRDQPYRPARISKEKALEKLKHYCGYQERSHSEVAGKLYSLGMFKNESEEIIAALISENYLNEERFAAQFASGKFRMLGWGRKKIQQGLKEKAVSSYNIRKALDSIDDSAYRESFSRQANKKWTALRSEKNIFVKKTKWRNYLLGKGFEDGLIRSFTVGD